LEDYFLKRGSIVAPDRFKELKIAEISKQLDALKQKFPDPSEAPSMTEVPDPPKTFIHVRGDFRSPGFEGRPATLSVLPPLPAGSTPNRLALARWLVQPDHPLTARVAVNRVWQE